MKNKKNILLTFDHELFLGTKSGSVDYCMIKPTNELQKIFNEFKIQKAIFFLDTTYLSCLKTHSKIRSFQKDFEKIKSNIHFLLDNGHYIFPHIHPHWLDAKYINGNWVLKNLKKYTFNACSIKERKKIWEESISILKEFNVESYHPIDSFRAGGWSIQPFKDYKPFFEKYGILNDFTVLPESYTHSNAQNFDFTSISSNSIYRFEYEVTKPVKNGKFF